MLLWTHRVQFYGTFQKFSDKSSKNFRSKAKKKDKTNYSEKNPQYVSLDMKCNFDNDVGIFPTKNK